MSPGDLRLRLLVRRNGVPDVKLVWPCTPTDDLTIAKLLTDVNDVIPLESTEWGLEDYTVELGDGTASSASFECLHFQLVSRTLKDEDQVLIRPLLDGDLKRRRLSGRDQISVDGKHLVDGVAFGRPWLKVPRGRPMLEIPPRKRARLMYEFEDISEDGEEDEEEEDYEDFMDEDGGDDEDEDEGDNEDEDEDSEAGEMLQLENGPQSEEGSGATSEEDEGDDENMDDELQLLRRDTVGGTSASTAAGRGQILRGLLPTLNGTAALRLAFPLLSSRVVEKELAKNENDVGQTYKVLLQSNHTALSFDEMMDKAVTGLLGDSSSADEDEETVPQAPPRPLIEEVDVGEPSLRIEELISDSDTSSSGSSDSSDSDSEYESASEEQSGDLVAKAEKATLNGIDVDEEDDEDSDSSFGGSDDEDEDDDGSSESSKDSSSDSSDESEAPSVQGTGQIKQLAVEKTTAKPREQPAPPEVPPGEGLTRTQKRNARRRKAKQAQQGLLEDSSNDVLEECLNDLAARKAALLNSLGEDKDDMPEPAPEVTAIIPTKKSTNDEAPVTETKEASEPKSAESAPRRLKMDLGAGRRLLLGALGLKNPKTKADEEKLRAETMKNVKPLQNPRLIEEVKDASEEVQPDEAWRDKIIYRAIECCHEGMELSEPPFPFVQRWDPQQHFNSMRKRKRQSQEFYDDYQDESQVYDKEPVEAESAKQSKKKKKKQSQQVEEPSVDELNYDDVAPQEHHDSPVADVDDLPALPADVNTLPALNKSLVKPGMVITWQELSMSKATNWQPQMINKTALVLGPGANDTVRVLLAKRDRDYDEKEYDEETGQRIYDRFEAPDFDEDEQVDADDDGNRLLSWQEVMDPRMVQQAAPSSSNQANGIDSDTVDSQLQKEIATTDQNEDHGHGSNPIQSAQQVPRLGSISADDALDSMTSDSWTSRAGEINQAACEISTSQTKQLGTTTDGVVEEAAMTEADAEVIADSNPLPEDHMPEFQGGVETILAATPREAPAVDGEGQAGSVDEELVIPESLPEASEKLGSPLLGAREPSSSPFPLIEEIYLTASMSKDSQLGEPMSAPVLPTVPGSAEYDEAMQRLDNGVASDEEDQPDALFPNATQPANRPPASPVAPHPRSTPDRRAKRKAKEAFVVPDGSQVIDLLSSPVTPTTPKRGRAAPAEMGSDSRTVGRRGGKRASTSTAAPKTRRTTSYQMLQTGEGSLRRRRTTNK